VGGEGGAAAQEQQEESDHAGTGGLVEHSLGVPQILMIRKDKGDKALTPQMRTARNNFLKFCRCNGTAREKWADVLAEDLSFDNMERYASYLINYTKYGEAKDLDVGSAQSYYSAVRKSAYDSYGGTQQELWRYGADAKWAELRDSITDAFKTKERAKKGKRLKVGEKANRALTQTLDDHEAINRSWFQVSWCV
jgi:hypothetical protein